MENMKLLVVLIYVQLQGTPCFSQLNESLKEFSPVCTSVFSEDFEKWKCRFGCPKTYYIDGLDRTDKTIAVECKKCSENCLQCTDELNCTFCSRKSYYTKENGRTFCIDVCERESGYFINMNWCEKCPPHCSKCHLSRTKPQSELICQKCYHPYSITQDYSNKEWNRGGRDVYQVHTRCVSVCPKGYYSHEGRCKQCEAGCAFCTNVGCYGCAPNYYQVEISTEKNFTFTKRLYNISFEICIDSCDPVIVSTLLKAHETRLVCQSDIVTMKCRCKIIIKKSHDQSPTYLVLITLLTCILVLLLVLVWKGSMGMLSDRKIDKRIYVEPSSLHKLVDEAKKVGVKPKLEETLNGYEDVPEYLSLQYDPIDIAARNLHM